ncbi:hypothetical protein PUN28_002289 [Cardiocondyla obscurior]|uniref:Uncharacterized protein n=1 Tax=Cardiocondyla obscurior TaxID=286306 RepID=A0AAW2GTM3_9HYME
MHVICLLVKETRVRRETRAKRGHVFLTTEQERCSRDKCFISRRVYSSGRYVYPRPSFSRRVNPTNRFRSLSYDITDPRRLIFVDFGWKWKWIPYEAERRSLRDRKQRPRDTYRKREGS